ncbi:MAG: glycoside hydrolase family 57 [Gammaproteobacteria bacterium]|nr:glycoside hydrolase family 57 [Gammaproteobacteria bacterium]
MKKPLSVIFYWHMHQPFYREAESGHYHLPWVYLHAIKDYTDMANILEQVPGARAVINYVPSLTAQIVDYAKQLCDWLNGKKGDLPDPLLNALIHETGEYTQEQRSYLLDACFRLNHEKNLHRYPDYTRLWNLAEHAKDQDSHEYCGPKFYTDLVTWYHLAWLGETVRNSHFVARRLMEKGRDFSCQDRRDLLALIAALLSEIPEKHRKLEAAGKIEITTTPYAHPIMPLMLDFNTALETVPDALLPKQSYPGGKERVIEHIEFAKRSHEDLFGHPAKGCWPSEGAVSEETLALLGQAGFDWCATGEGVLHNSLGRNIREGEPAELYQPWLVGEGEDEITCFFRDDHLSDLLGFEYSRWDMHDAVNNFMHELAGIRHRTQGVDNPVVAIIMDGENAWEHFHENALPFLTHLYQSIVKHEDYELTTFSDYLATAPATNTLQKMTAGSWVYGNLSTWIGDKAKTLGWEHLIEAKQAYDQAYSSLSSQQQAAASEQLRICEGSDWCWWFGDYNLGPVVRDFDRLYRQHLKKLYALLGKPYPSSLDEDISKGGDEAEGGGTMRRGNKV